MFQRQQQPITVLTPQQYALAQQQHLGKLELHSAEHLTSSYIFYLLLRSPVVAHPMMFKWARQLGSCGQQQEVQPESGTTHDIERPFSDKVSLNNTKLKRRLFLEHRSPVEKTQFP